MRTSICKVGWFAPRDLQRSANVKVMQPLSMESVLAFNNPALPLHKNSFLLQVDVCCEEKKMHSEREVPSENSYKKLRESRTTQSSSYFIEVNETFN